MAATQPDPDDIDLDLERNPGLLRDLFDRLGEGVFTIDPTGRIVAWSRGAAELTGRSPGAAIGASVRILAEPADRGVLDLLDWLHAGAVQELCSFTCRVGGAPGTTQYLAGEVAALRDRRGELLGAVGRLRAVAEFIARSAPVSGSAPGAGVDHLLGLVGGSQPMREVFRRTQLAARSDVTTLITGESGTGKELVAQAVHALSQRATGPFLAVNCGALPETLLESELFGHDRGAFTGAVRDRPGMLELAHGGTLFLDEIGDVSPMLQVKLLRALQERRIRRVGGSSETPIDVRLVTATNKNLERLLGDGRMREDFYYRIRVYEIPLPPLRERKGDIALLVEHFRGELNDRLGRDVLGLAPTALQRLLAHDWPGNVRELRNAIEHAYVCVQGEWIEAEDLPPDIGSGAIGRADVAAAAPGDDGDTGALTPRQADERQRILAQLAQHDWNRIETARALGFSRVTLWKKMRRYRIDEGLFRRG